MKKIKILGVVLFLLSSTAYTDNLNIKSYDTFKIVEHISSDTTIQSQLRIVLGQDYSKFYQNIETYASPYKLKTANALYYEGRNKEATAYSAATIYEDGRIFAATFDQENNILKYFTNDASCTTDLHPTIKAFSKQFITPKIVYANSNNNSILRFNINQKSNCSSYITPSTQLQSKIKSRAFGNQEAARNVATDIWNASIANSWDYNEEIGVVLSQAINAIKTCSANFNLVPKPPGYGSAPGLKYIGKYFTNILAYITGVKTQPIYRTCIVTVAASYRTAMQLASLGI